MKIIPLVLLTFVLASCASSKSVQDNSYKILQNFAFEVSQYVEFDPYSARIHFNRDIIQAKLSMVQLQLQQNGCGKLSPITMSFPSESDFREGFVGNYGIQNDAWKTDLYRQITQNQEGWAIAQVEFPKAGMMHGDYSLKGVLMFYVSWCGSDEYGLTPAFYIDIKSKAKESAAEAPSKPTDDSVVKLKKLKEMLDAGLINQQDYDSKKKLILEGL